MARNSIHYNVAPRYSAGSPAQVPLHTAQGVVDDEQRGYDATLEGIYGAEATAKAQAQGLKGIVEERTERTDCWLVTDMMTGDRFIRPFPSNLDGKTPVQVRKHTDRLRLKYHLPVEGTS